MGLTSYAACAHCCRRSEGVGVVEQSGSGASKFQPGQRVVAAGWASGTWQDYIVQPEATLVSLCVRYILGTSSRSLQHPFPGCGQARLHHEVSEDLRFIA